MKLDRYFFHVLSVETESNPDFQITGENQFNFSSQLWSRFADIVLQHCQVTKEATGITIEPKIELPCLNTLTDPAPGDELFQLEKIPENVHIGYVLDLPQSLFVSDFVVRSVAGEGFSGIGFIEVEDMFENRPTFSFVRRLPELRKADCLIDLIAEYCELGSKTLIRFTSRDVDFEYQGIRTESQGFLTDSGLFFGVSTNEKLHVLNADGELIGQLTD